MGSDTGASRNVWTGLNRPFADGCDGSRPSTCTGCTPKGCERLATYAADAFSHIRNTRNPLQHTLTMLAAAAFHARERFGFEDLPWTLMGMYTRGRLLAPPRGG
ncbi:hypothetical protein [Rhodococcus opacus]|uniref:hypothetical protein n=1 Tax=Rhodococcus opacus TaxID=37919 RepID=UPI0029CA2A38|nr:hypothetical protein [Rhodococcus opacus]